MPVTHTDLFPDIASFSGLYRGYREARKGKRCKGEVIMFADNVEENLLELSRELKTREYRPKGFKIFTAYDPKERTIHSPYFRDRVVHRSLHYTLDPIFENTFIYDTYACRENRGTHAAVDRLQSFMRKDVDYYLECDIKSYFDSVDHDTLLDIIGRKVADEDVHWLISMILDEYAHGIAPDKGMAIGTLYSQLFANVYLNPFDHFVKESLQADYYIRYMDDFILLSDSKERLHELKAAMQGYLRDELKLELPDSKAFIEPIEKGATYLGYRVFPHFCLLRQRNKIKFKRALRQHKKDVSEGEKRFDEVQNSIASWRGHASHAATYNLQKKYDVHHL